MAKVLIEVKDIRKIYQQKNTTVHEALKGVSLDIKEGEIICLLGVNGAGKTTLSTIISSLHPPSSGDILWKRKSIYEDLISYKRIIGLCPQKPNLDKTLTLEENLVFSGRYFGQSKKEATDRKNELIKTFVLESYKGSLVDQLSGGYKQRFLIARTLMHRPKLVILDEPTVGLDAHIRRALWDVIRSLKEQGTTVLLTTHYLDEAEALSDRVCLIHGGEIYSVDTPEKLKKKHGKKTLEEVFLQFIDDASKKEFKEKIE